MQRYVVMGCFGATFAFCCVSSGLLLGWGVVATAATEDAAQACDGHPVLNAGLAASRPAHVLAFTHGIGSWIWAGDELPSSFAAAETTGEANIVFCFEEEVVVDVETCHYVRNNNERTVGGIRRQRTRRVRAVEPRTATVLRDVTLYGDAPPECPDSLYGGGTYEYEGGSPDTTDFEAAMSDLVR